MKEKLSTDQIAEENRQANDLPNDAAEPTREPAAEAPEAREPAQESEKKEIPVGSKFATKRDSIYKKFRERRDGEDDGHAERDPEREKVLYGERVETRSDREARRSGQDEPPAAEPGAEPGAEPQKPAVEEPAPTRHRLKVNKREIELSEEEVHDLARQALAAGDILRQAKQLKAEQHTILEELRAAKAIQSQDGKQSSDPQSGDDPASIPDDAELDEIINKIQVGDPEEAKAAFRKYGENLEQRLLERIGNLDDRIAETTQTITETNERRRQTMETLEAFGQDYPEFTKSPSLQTALAHETASRMREAMLEIGVREETLEGLKQQRGWDDNTTIAFAYRTLQQRGHELKDHATLLREAADGLRTTFGVQPKPNPTPPPNTATDVAERTERKRAMAPQPRRAGVPPSTDTRERSREDARREAVRQMRLSRRGRA